MSELIKRIRETYDELPYLSSAFTQSAPEHLHAVAHLFGLTTPDPSSARVLELGCAAGGNLIPFAARYPAARALGVDLSGVQIEAGNRAIDAMGLDNIELRHANITELGDDLGEFDYIICHGVYSWVPEDVREAILRISRRHLAANGVAYISYNTYPGWKAKEVVRDAMLLRSGPRNTPQEKLGYARGMIDFLHDMAREDSVLKKIMQENIGMIRHGHDHYLSHEFLELCNAPCYFRDFIEAANRHGLGYLAEAEITGMFASNHGSKVAELLLRECNGSQLALEQLLDFLTNRTFRQTLLVAAERCDSIRYGLDASRFADLQLSGRFTADQNPPGELWKASSGLQLRMGSPIARQIVHRLNASWPGTVAVTELIRAAREAAADPQAAQADVLSVVENLVIFGAVRVRLAPIQPPSDVDDDRPQVPAALRRLLALHRSTPVPISLYNTWHEPLADPGPVASVLLPLLDGRHDRAMLAAALRDSFRRGEVSLAQEGQPLADDAAIDEAAAGHVDSSLREMAALGLFMRTD